MRCPVLEGSNTKAAARVTVCVAAVIFGVISLLWISYRKGDQEWSNIPSALDQLSYWIGKPSQMPLGIPGPGDEVTLTPLPPDDDVYVPTIVQKNSPWKIYMGTALIRNLQGFEPGPYASHVIGCDFLVAVDYLTHMQIVNQSDKPSKIQAYSIEVHTVDGKWKLLRRLLFAPNKKFYFLHREGLQTSEMTLPLLDDSIQNVITPNGSAQGFALFSYPDSVHDMVLPPKLAGTPGLYINQFSILDIQITIEDGGTTQISPYKEIGGSDSTMKFSMSKPIDTDYETFKFYTFAHACR